MSPNGAPTDDGLVQLLTPAGDLVENPVYTPLVAHLDADALRGMYRDMVLVRRFDAEATALQRQGELGLWAQSLGQEAAQVGSGRALSPQDYVFPSYREHGVAHTRGVDLADLLVSCSAVSLSIELIETAPDIFSAQLGVELGLVMLRGASAARVRFSSFISSFYLSFLSQLRQYH